MAKQHKIPIKRIPSVCNLKTPVHKIIPEIYNSAFVIIDISGKDPDVMYLLGFIHLICKPLIFLTQNLNDIPFDLKNDRHIVYDSSESSIADIAVQLKPIFHHLQSLHILVKDSSKHTKSDIKGIKINGVKKITDKLIFQLPFLTSLFPDIPLATNINI